MRQAITTKYIGPTNSRGSRIKATCSAGSLTVSRDCSLSIEGNHTAAARALVEKYGWGGTWHGGGNHESGFVFVDVQDNEPAFTLATRA